MNERGNPRNLHRIMGAQFTRFKPLLCPHCQHFSEHSEWYGVCGAKQTLLSNPKPENPKRNQCDDYSPKATEN